MKKFKSLFISLLTMIFIICNFSILVQASEQTSTNETKYVALTFDDGPISKTTSRLLDALDKYDAKATFFLVGNMAYYYKDTVKRIYDSGHEIGNHSYTHRDLTTLSTDDVIKEITQTSDLIKSITGANPTLVRTPYGSRNKTTDAVLKAYGFPSIMWNVDPLDWKYRDVNHVYNAVKDNLKDGNVILMHDIHATTVDAAINIIKNYSNKGYKFVTVSELAAIKNTQLIPGQTYYNFK